MRSCLVLLAVTGFVGCQGAQFVRLVDEPLPSESREATMLEYIVNPPDVLVVDVEPGLGGRTLQPGDEIVVDIQPTVRDANIVDTVIVSADGKIELPPIPDRAGQFRVPPVDVKGLKITIAQQKVAAAVRKEYPSALVSLFQGNSEIIYGQFLVRPDGTVKVGMLPQILVAGQSLTQIESMIREIYCQSTGVNDARVAVDVLAYNSMCYYIIADGGGFGDQVIKLPFTGRERVLDAIAEVGGLPNNGSRLNMWVARPVPGCEDQARILPVDWEAVVKHGQAKTNYQIMPGDRLYIKTDHMIATDNILAKFLSPIDRVLATISLFSVAQQGARGENISGGGN